MLDGSFSFRSVVQLRDDPEVGLFGVKLTRNAHLGQLRRRWVGGIGPKSLVRVADYASNVDSFRDCRW